MNVSEAIYKAKCTLYYGNRDYRVITGVLQDYT